MMVATDDLLSLTLTEHPISSLAMSRVKMPTRVTRGVKCPLPRARLPGCVLFTVALVTRMLRLPWFPARTRVIHRCLNLGGFESGIPDGTRRIFDRL